MHSDNAFERLRRAKFHFRSVSEFDEVATNREEERLRKERICSVNVVGSRQCCSSRRHSEAAETNHLVCEQSTRPHDHYCCPAWKRRRVCDDLPKN